MPASEAQVRAKKKYAQTPKGKEVLMKAHKKRADTEEYRAYQREKQKEYRQRRKLEAARGEVVGETTGSADVDEKVNPLVTLVLHARVDVEPKVEAEVKTALRSLLNRSEYIRDAVIKQLREDGLLKSFQDSTAVEAIKPHAQKN